MNKTERLMIKVLPDQKAALVAMAETEGEPVAVVLRRLIRTEARRRGLLPSGAKSESEVSDHDAREN